LAGRLSSNSSYKVWFTAERRVCSLPISLRGGSSRR
jgi:hypothetical protein